MKYIKILVVAIAGLVLAAASSHATLLVDLLRPGATLQVGDKIFANFTWEGPISASAITITGIGDGSALDLYGIEIGGPLGQYGAGSTDLRLGYSVTVAPGAGYLISDIHQFASLAGSPGSLVDISESVLDAAGGNQVAASHVGEGINYSSFDPNDPPAELNDVLYLANPLQQVWIKKDILFVAYGPNDYAAATIIDQRFSQVPEPTTMIAGALLLLPFGASTLRILRKNRTA
jgi:hypothetical protein